MQIDRITRLLLAAIAAGIWTLVVVAGIASARIATLQAAVDAIGADTARIHEDIDPGGEDEDPDAGRTSSRRPDRMTGRVSVARTGTGTPDVRR